MKDNDPNINTKCTAALDKLNENIGSGNFGATDLDDLILQHPACEKQLRDAYRLWMELGELEVPPVPEGARTRFFTMLDEFEEEQPRGKIVKISIPLSILKWAAVFIIGLAAGILFSNRSGSNKVQDTSPVSNQFLTSLDAAKPATEKLKVLQTIKENSDPEEYVYEALYKTILNDPNVNVRLSAIEAMLHFSNKPKARMLLLKALTYQESPIVQLSLAEVIIKLQENGSTDEIRQLLNSDHLDLEVKIHLKETLSQI